MIQQVIDLLHKYPVQAIAVWGTIQTSVTWAFSAFVDSLDEPKPMGPLWYRFAYKFGHGLAGNRTEAKKDFTTHNG